LVDQGLGLALHEKLQTSRFAGFIGQALETAGDIAPDLTALLAPAIGAGEEKLAGPEPAAFPAREARAARGDGAVGQVALGAVDFLEIDPVHVEPFAHARPVGGGVLPVARVEAGTAANGET